MDKTQDWAIKISFLIIAYLTPLKFFAIALTVLVIIDWFTGVRKAWITGERCFPSNKIQFTVDKVVSYGVFVIIFFILENTILHVSWGITEVAISILALIEVKSVCENLYIITGLDIFKQFSNLVQNKMKVFTNIKDVK